MSSESMRRPRLLLCLNLVAIVLPYLGLGAGANVYAYDGDIDHAPARPASALTLVAVERPADARARVVSEASTGSSHTYDVAAHSVPTRVAAPALLVAVLARPGQERPRSAVGWEPTSAHSVVAAEGGPLPNIPEDAALRALTPQEGGVQEGVEYKWVDENGQTNRFRVHGPDPGAPPDSNSFEGPTYRWRIGGRYIGGDGTLYPQGVSNPNSPFYDPAAANATHIPWPGLPNILGV